MSSCQRANSGGTPARAPGAQNRFGFCSVIPIARSPRALPLATSGERVSAGVGVGVASSADGLVAAVTAAGQECGRQQRGRDERSQTAETSSSSATRKEEPQPQAATTLGLSTLKPAPCRPST